MKVLLSLIVMCFLGLVAFQDVPQFNSIQHKKKTFISIRRDFDRNYCFENSAEYNFYEMAFSLIVKLLSGRYASLINKFGYKVYITANNKFEQNTHWVCQFPGVVRAIRWHELNNDWNGRRDGLDTMLSSLPGLLANAIYSGNKVEERELRALLNFGKIAVKHREDLDTTFGGDEGHQQSTNLLGQCYERTFDEGHQQSTYLLRRCYESLERFIEDMFNSTSNSHHNELLRRGFSADVYYGGKDFTVKFYENDDFVHELHERFINASSNGQCYNLPDGACDKTSSVHTGHGCVVLYQMLDCEGRCTVLLPGSYSHDYLSLKGFNDVTKSYRSC